MKSAGRRNKRGVFLGTGALASEFCPSTRERTGSGSAGGDPELRQQLQQTQEELRQLRERGERVEALVLQ